MSLLHAQEYTTTSYRVRLNNGSKATLPFSEVQNVFNNADGVVEERRIAARNWMKESLKTQLGEENFNRVFKECDFDTETGVPLLIIVTA